MKQLVLFTLIVGLSQFSFARKSRFKVFKENSDKRAVIVNSRPVSFFYEKLSWNQQPTDIESGYLYLRNKGTGKLYELNMLETAPNSGVFSVNFPIGVLESAKVSAEMYSAPQSMLRGKNRIELMKDFIEDGSVKRKPFLLRVLRQKGQIVDVFDDKENAFAAYNKYRKEMGLDPEQAESDSIIEVANQQKVQKKKIIDTSTLQSLFLANENNLDANNARNAEEREVMLNIERKRRDGVKKNASVWSLAEKRGNNRLATEKIKEGVGLLKSGANEEAMDRFYKASDLAPDEEDIYQQYGVSLYRIKKYNQALVVLDLSKPSKKRIPEKYFYMGLSFYQLKDYRNAIKYFDKVMDMKDSTFGPTAAFYKGSALLEMKEFDKSKEAFQYVLDNSKDPAMDKKAEQFIEYGLDRKALEKKRSNWWRIDGVLGLMYDSNIILADDQLTQNNDVTNENGWRLLGMISPKFRPYYSDSDEINIALNVTTLKSFDDGFGSNQVAETADPLVLSAGVPWTHRGTLGGKGYFFDLIPGYEQIIMDLDGTGNATISNSIKLNFNNTLVVNKNWIAKGDYSFASVDSNILGDEEGADAFAAGLKLSSIFILNKDLERYLIPSFSYRINDAKTSTYAFNRVDIGVTFTSAIWSSFVWNSRVGYYLSNYESTRTDNNYTLSTGLSRRINVHLNWGVNASYIINDSTTNLYDKYNILSTLSFSY